VSRVGWTVLLLFLAGFGALAAMTSFEGGGAAIRRIVARKVPAVAPGGLVLPVAGYARATLTDSWGDARGGGTRGHRGIDLMAPGGTAVVAVAPGRVEKLFESRLGGTTLYQRSSDGRWLYYYAHLAGYAPGLREGAVVRQGQVLGYVGDTGDAGAGNTHLHFSASRMRPGQRWWEGEDVNPYPLLAGAASAR
jgi:peptidoglycan LD-endopeptidase LytH